MAEGDFTPVENPAWQNSIGAVQAQQQAAAALGALFGLPLYSGTNAVGQPYSNQLKPGADFMAKRTAQAAENERVTNAFQAKPYMPSWAVQQAPANWLGARQSPRAYFPGIDTVSGGAPGVGTNLGFGTMFGTLAPSGQTPGEGTPTIGSNTVVNGGTSIMPERPSRTGGTGTLIAPPGTPRNPNSTPGYTNSTGTGGPTRVPLGPAPYNPGNVFTSPIQNVTGTSTVAQSTGRNYYNPQTFAHSVEALPPELAGAYIPPQYVGHALPAGAFKTLWPNSVGTDWVKVKPEGWSPTWRPTGTRG